MKVAVFSTKPYDRSFLAAAAGSHEFVFFEPRLARETTKLAAGFPAVCVFVNDELDASVLKQLADQGTKLIALRCAGFNNVDLAAARDLGLTVVRVPGYSPYAVAEHTVALILALNRKLHRSHARVREGNFELNGLLGFDLHGRTVGIVGTGKIGAIVARIMHGFGCRVLAYDVSTNSECESLSVTYVPLSAALRNRASSACVNMAEIVTQSGGCPRRKWLCVLQSTDQTSCRTHLRRPSGKSCCGNSAAR